MIHPDTLKKLSIELRLAGSDRDIPTVGRLVDVVVRRSEVEDVGLGLVGPEVLGAEPVEQCREERDPIDHRGVDDLSEAGSRPLEQGPHDADQQQHPPAAVVAEEVQRRHRGLAPPAKMVKSTGESHIVDVVPRRGRVRTILTPPCHSGVDEAGIATETGLGTETEAFGHTGAAPFHQDVGPVDQLQSDRVTVGVGQVQSDGPLSPCDEVNRPPAFEQPHHGCLVRIHGHVAHATDRDDVSTQVSEHHRGEGTGSAAVQLDNPQS